MLARKVLYHTALLRSLSNSEKELLLNHSVYQPLPLPSNLASILIVDSKNPKREIPSRSSSAVNPPIHPRKSR